MRSTGRSIPQLSETAMVIPNKGPSGNLDCVRCLRVPPTQEIKTFTKSNVLNLKDISPHDDEDIAIGVPELAGNGSCPGGSIIGCKTPAFGTGTWTKPECANTYWLGYNLPSFRHFRLEPPRGSSTWNSRRPNTNRWPCYCQHSKAMSVSRIGRGSKCIL